MPTRKTKTSVKTKAAVKKTPQTKVKLKATSKNTRSKKVVVKKPKQTKRLVAQSTTRFTQLKKWLADKQQLLAIVGIVIGLNLILASGWYLLYRRTILSFQVSPSVTSEIRKEAPTRITIAGMNHIDAPVTQGVIKEGIWEVSDTSIVHLETSAYPGQPGNIIMYGHNRDGLFKLLPTVKVGDVILVETDGKEQHRYQVTEIMTVKPTEIEVVLPTDHEVLTVYTCTGWFDSLRFVVKAEPITS